MYKVTYKSLIFFLTPILLYLVPFLAALHPVLPVIGIAPILLLQLKYLPNVTGVLNLKEYGFLQMFILSGIIYSFRNDFNQGVVVFSLLFIFPHVFINAKVTTLDQLNDLFRKFGMGFILLFLVAIYLPTLINYPYTLGSWYLVASEEIPTVRSTLDGPLVIIFIVSFISITFRDRSLSQVIKPVAFVSLLILFYTLLVFNRRVLILLFFLVIPIILFNLVTRKEVFFLIFLGTFLLPIFFSLILIYANEIFSIPEVQSLVLRTGDLDPETNRRLSGWLLAANSFMDFSLSEDFFGYHKELVRSTDDRYNHFHNGYIQLYYEQGVFGFVTLVLLLFQLTFSVKVYRRVDLKQYPYLMVPLVFAIVVVILCVTESVYRRISISNISFILSAAMILKVKQIVRKLNLS